MTQPVDFGQCWGTPNGQGLSSPSYMAKGFQVVAEAVLRRWSTPRGRLIDDPNYGTDVADSINDDLSPRDIAYLGQQLAAEAQKDERVLKAVVTVTLTTAGLLTIVGGIQTAAGPFKMVVAVSQTSTTLLMVSP
jgi:hypothetical protein